MANHKSAIKAHKQNVARRARNRELRSQMRHALKSVRSAIDSGEGSGAKDTLRSTVSLLDKLAHKGIIHPNAAARHKSRATRQLQKTSTSV